MYVFKIIPLKNYTISAVLKFATSVCFIFTDVFIKLGPELKRLKENMELKTIF